MLVKDMNHLSIPPFAYLPLCKSTDPWRHVISAVPAECHSFSTKARCPALVFFEVEEHPEKCDVASFLALELQEYVNGDTDDAQLEDAEIETESVLHGVQPSVYTMSPPPQFQQRNGSSKSRSSAAGSAGSSGFRSVSGRKSVWKDDAGAAGGAACEVSSEMQSPSAKIAGGETFQEKASRVRAELDRKQISGWQLDGLIAKSNDDVRQEVFVMQFIVFYHRIFVDNNIDVFLRPYHILSTSKTTGIIQLIPDCISFDGLKKKAEYPGSLKSYFDVTFPEPADRAFAVKEFVRSMAGYSIVTYLLAIKDR